MINWCMVVLGTFLLAQVASAATFSEDRTYQYNIFGSEQACQEYRKKNPVVNCYQYANFSKDGNVFALFTDMPNLGTYSVEENTIHAIFSIHNDAPEEMTFILFADQRSATNSLDEHIWHLKQQVGQKTERE